MKPARLTDDERRTVETNLRLVHRFLSKRNVRPATYDDRFQDGVLGLMRAAQLFDPARGYQFSTYAMFWIRQGVDRGIEREYGVNFRRGDAFPVSLDQPRRTGARSRFDAGTVNDTQDRESALAYDEPGYEAVENAVDAVALVATLNLDAGDVALLNLTAYGSLRTYAAEQGASEKALSDRRVRLRRRLREAVALSA